MTAVVNQMLMMKTAETYMKIVMWRMCQRLPCRALVPLGNGNLIQRLVFHLKLGVRTF